MSDTASGSLVVLNELSGTVARAACEPLSRRQALRVGAGGLAALGGAGMLPGLGRQAEAGPAVFLAKAATLAAVGWLVERLLDDWFADEFREQVSWDDFPGTTSRRGQVSVLPRKSSLGPRIPSR